MLSMHPKVNVKVDGLLELAGYTMCKSVMSYDVVQIKI